MDGANGGASVRAKGGPNSGGRGVEAGAGAGQVDLLVVLVAFVEVEEEQS